MNIKLIFILVIFSSCFSLAQPASDEFGETITPPQSSEKINEVFHGTITPPTMEQQNSVEEPAVKKPTQKPVKKTIKKSIKKPAKKNIKKVAKKPTQKHKKNKIPKKTT